MVLLVSHQASTQPYTLGPLGDLREFECIDLFQQYHDSRCVAQICASLLLRPSRSGWVHYKLNIGLGGSALVDALTTTYMVTIVYILFSPR